MPKPPPQDTLPSPAFVDAFTACADAEQRMPFERFMQLALYHPQLGYYRGERKRVGYGQGTDFFTASSTGALFGELVHAACRSLLSVNALSEYTFVEIGAEPSGGILASAQHTFGAVRTIRVGEPLEIEGKCVVFSNELFDAQPFRRFRLSEGRWRELGVQWIDGQLREIALAPTTAELPAQLPTHAPEGYSLDLPLAATALAKEIVSQPWTGLFIAFDYGKSWRELIEAQPAGTARAYFRHQQSNDLLARPGHQDLTCHVCWDWLADALREGGFAQPTLETQEAFLIRRAADFMSSTVAAEAAHLSKRKLGLLQLLQQLGQKFQVLWGLR
ncbi:MAG: SAM-dependent methyltransferase [Nibricoccus sp.]